MKLNKNTFFNNALIDATSRLICICSLLWFGLIVIEYIDSLTPQSKTGRSTTTFSDYNFSNSLDFANGYWAFADSPLTTQKISCDQAELDRRLEMIVSDDRQVASNCDATEFIRIAESVGIKPVESSNKLVWIYDEADLQIRLVTSRNKTPLLTSAAVATRYGARWELMVLKPRATVDAHLLPLSAETQSLCRRRDEAGRLQFELLTTSDADHQLLDRWRSAGWEIQHTPWGSATSFSYLCARGDQAIYAWSPATTDKRKLILSVTNPHASPAKQLTTQTKDKP